MERALRRVDAFADFASRSAFSALSAAWAARSVRSRKCSTSFSVRCSIPISLFFASLTLLLFVTFLSGGLAPVLQAGGPLSLWDGTGIVPAVLPVGLAQAAFAVLGVTALSLGGWCVAELVRQWRAAGRPAGLGLALGYFGVQVAAALMAATSFPRSASRGGLLAGAWVVA